MPGESQAAPSTGRPDPTVMTTEQMLLAVKNLEKLTGSKFKISNEKFKSIETQLQLIERQRVEQKADTKNAVDAALSAAKEAVKEQTTASQLATNKTETSFAEQLRQQAATFSTAIDGLTTLINDLKERVGRIESRQQNVREQTTDQRSNANLQLVIASVFIAAISAAVALVSVLTR